VNRTLDTKIFSLLLYRLSYLPTEIGGANIGTDPRIVMQVAGTLGSGPLSAVPMSERLIGHSRA
jgi:hypothetical protein